MPAKILVIDDDAEVREMVRLTLRIRGYIVHEAADGRIGLAMMDEVKPDLVILDLMLPGMSGTEVMRHLRADPNHAGTPVIILSVVGDKTQRTEEFWRQGLSADEFMAKTTFRPDDLLGRVAYLLNRDSYRSAQVAPEARGGGAPAPPQDNDLASAAPEMVVRRFIEAWNDGDFALEYDCLSEKLKPNLTKPDYVARRRSKFEEPGERTVRQYLKEVLAADDNGQAATVKVRRENHREGRIISRVELYDLEHTGLGWKISNVRIL
jgi:CheY-like chemotaxis protein